MKRANKKKKRKKRTREGEEYEIITLVTEIVRLVTRKSGGDHGFAILTGCFALWNNALPIMSLRALYISLSQPLTTTYQHCMQSIFRKSRASPGHQNNKATSRASPRAKVHTFKPCETRQSSAPPQKKTTRVYARRQPSCCGCSQLSAPSRANHETYI